MNKKTVGLMAMMLCGCGMVTSGRYKRRAEADARAYVHQIHPHWASAVVACQGVDSDDDGYVRCTVGDGNTNTESIECRTSLTFNYQRGCVPMRLSVRGVR